MTLDEAAAHVGEKVIYRPPHQRAAVGTAEWSLAGPPEEGVITSVNKVFAFVRYGAQATAAATHPRDLELLAGGPR